MAKTQGLLMLRIFGKSPTDAVENITRILIILFFLTCLANHCGLIASEQKTIPSKDTECFDESLYVSLGSWCDVAINLRKNGMRKIAFPFDWIASVDCKMFLELVSSDFAHFLDDEYLFVKDNHFFNSYYRIEFPHDHCVNPESLEEWENFKAKYTRRINRFREIEHHKGKVYFIRSSFGYSNHPDRYFKCPENVSISDAYAWELFYVLKNRFPQVNFVLIIIDCSRPYKKLSESLFRLQDYPSLTQCASLS